MAGCTVGQGPRSPAARNADFASSRLSATLPLGPCDGARLLLDDLVRAHQNRSGYGKAERRGGLEVQDHLKFCRKLNG
jgi:hypothetical protein